LAPFDHNAGHWHSTAAVAIASQRQAHETFIEVVCVNSKQLAIDLNGVSWANEANVRWVDGVVHVLLSLMGPEPLGS